MTWTRVRNDRRSIDSCSPQQPPRRFGVAAIERRLHAGQHARCSAGGETLCATIARCSRRVITLPFVGIVCRQPHKVAPGAQLGGDVQVPAAPRVGQQRRHPARQLTELSLVHQRPDHEILRDVHFPRDADALVAQNRQRLLGQTSTPSSTRPPPSPSSPSARMDNRDRVRIADALSPAPSTAGRAAR